MYDEFEGARRKPTRIEEQWEEMRVTEEQVRTAREAMQKRSPKAYERKEKTDTPLPFVPYYRKTAEERERDRDRPMTYKKTVPYSVKELATNTEAYKSWKDQLEEKKELDRKWMGGRKGVSGDPKLVGTMHEVAAGRFRKGEREVEKKEIDPALNMQDHGFERDEETGHFLLNGTRVPQRFDHWIEEPGTVKTSRDLRLLKKIERAREKAAAQHRARNLGLAAHNRSDAALDQRHLVTRRMLRVSSLILDEVSKALEALPNYLATQSFSASKNSGAASKNSASRATISPSSILSSGLVSFEKVEVSRDLLHAKVFWHAPEHSVALAERELDRACPALRHLVTQAIQMKYSPELIFVRETTSQAQQEAHETLNRVEKAYAEYAHSQLSPYLPPNEFSHEFAIAPTSHSFHVNLQKHLPAHTRPLKTAFQEKLIRSRWASHVQSSPLSESDLAEWKPSQ